MTNRNEAKSVLGVDCSSVKDNRAIRNCRRVRKAVVLACRLG
jgi:hypothetical protein